MTKTIYVKHEHIWKAADEFATKGGISLSAYVEHAIDAYNTEHHDEEIRRYGKILPIEDEKLKQKTALKSHYPEKPKRKTRESRSDKEIKAWEELELNESQNIKRLKKKLSSLKNGL